MERVSRTVLMALAVLREKWALVCLILLALSLAVGTYLRMLPAMKYGLELDEADPFIMYYIAKHFYEKGLFSFRELKNQDLFWYPYGRDLLRQEYIGVGWISAATYPIVSLVSDLTLREWVALQPVVINILTTIAMYILVYRITGSHSGALTAAILYSITPAALSRTTVGFVEKMTIAFLPITLHYILLYEALSSADRNRSILLAALAGLAGGLVAFIWGGYHYVALSLALVILLDVTVYGSPSWSRLLVYAITLASKAVAIAIAPATSITYFLNGMGLIPLAALLVYAGILAWKKLGLDEKLFPYNRLIHLWLITTGVVAGLVMVYLGVLELPGRALLALGVRGFSPLAESVSEHQPLGVQAVVSELGVPVLLAVAGLALSAVDAYRGRGGSRTHLSLVLSLMAILMVYASINMAYFLQTATFYSILVAGVAVGLAATTYLAQSLRVEDKTGRRARGRGRPGGVTIPSDLRLAISLGLVALIALYSAYSVNASYEVNSLRAPQIMTSGLGVLTLERGKTVVPLNNAWIRALEYLRSNTSENDVVVSWWDYGYWISVDAGRKTLADGSTWNETHIRLLARILTGSESEAVALLELIGLKPNSTYIVFYEVFIAYSRAGEPFSFITPMPNVRIAGNIYYVVYGLADFPKSFQMLRIAYRTDPRAESYLETDYYSVTQAMGRTAYLFPGFAGSPVTNVEKVLSTLIYRLALHGVALLPAKCLGNCGFLQNTTIVIPSVLDPAAQRLHFVPVDPPERFALEAVVADVFYETTRGDLRERYVVLVFIYKWVR